MKWNGEIIHVHEQTRDAGTEGTAGTAAHLLSNQRGQCRQKFSFIVPVSLPKRSHPPGLINNISLYNDGTFAG